MPSKARSSQPKRSKRKSVKADEEGAEFFGVRISNPDRVIFDEPKLTKGDLAAYYASVAERLLPFVVDRPLSLVRCPEGTRGKCFFQKHPPAGLPDVVERIPVQEKDEVDTYLVIHDAAGLLTLVQFGAIEFHTWGARSDNLEKPDQLVVDLDPGPDVPWDRVIGAALELRDLLAEIELESFVKTTGGKGLHVCVPIVRKWRWDEIKSFCRALAERITAAAPDQFIAKATKSARGGKIFVDYLRNDRGATFVAPYSCRARRGAPLAMPLSWEELFRIKSAAEFTVETVAARPNTRRGDPWEGFFTIRQSLKKTAIQRVQSIARR